MSSEKYQDQFKLMLEARGRLVNLIDIVQKIDPKSCIYCEHFDEPNEACRKSNNQRPPARIIATGCEAFENNDDIPF